MSSKRLSVSLLLAAAVFGLLIPVALIHGFPMPLLTESPLHAKSTRKLFEFFLVFSALGVLIHPERHNLLSRIETTLEDFAASPKGIVSVAAIYFLLFFWENVTRVFSLQINFIPFLFYDYMLWYLNQGHWCYTGWLHGDYHINLAMAFLYPFWKIFKSPWVLHVAQPALAALASFPLFFWARDRLKSSARALVVAFCFLNFRYLQNVLSVNFAVEIFYPLFIFSAVYFASRKQNRLYFLAVIGGLMVKEDSVIYFSGLGFFFLFDREQRARGLATLLLAAGYSLFILKIFVPWSGTHILEGDTANYRELGAAPQEIILSAFKQPLSFVKELFLPAEKIKTIWKLVSKLLLLPLFSPWFFLVLLSIYPLFFRSVEGNQFIQLSLYYAAPVLPFLFLAMVDGWRRVLRWSSFQKYTILPGILSFFLILFNGMNFRPIHFTRGDLETLRWAKAFAPGEIVVTQGHLLPYLPYREWNFYWAKPYGSNPSTRERYLNPDAYFFDLNANAYPNGVEELKAFAASLRQRPDFFIEREDERRVLMRRKQ